MSISMAIVGAGWVSEHRHIPALRSIPGVRIAGVIDPAPGRAEQIARKFGIEGHSTETSLDRVPWIDGVNAVCLSPPPPHHFHWIKQSLERNLDILTEKPLAANREEGAQIEAMAGASSAMFCVIHNNLFTRSAIRTRSLIREDAIGPLTGLNIRLLNSPLRHLPTWYDDLPFGLLFDELSHFLYLADSYTTNLQVKHAEAFPSTRNMRTPSLAQITLVSDRFPVTFHLNFESPVCEWHATLIGRDGLLIHDIFRDILMRVPTDRTHTARDHFRTMTRLTGSAWTGFVQSGWRHLRGRLAFGTDEVMKRFVHACQTREPPEHMGAENGFRIFNLLCDCIDALEGEASAEP